MQIEKILWTIFLSVLAGFFTAAISIVKLVNDKENKTTDYRQAWTDSLRRSFADLISNINLLASSLTVRLEAADQSNGLASSALEHEIEKKELPTQVAALQKYFDEKLNAEESHVRQLWQSLHQSYALTRLHFKPNDLAFSRVEQKFDTIIEMLDKLSLMRGEEEASKRPAMREKLHAAAGEMTGYSRDILKTEWEAVKKGERAYQYTKTWSIIGGAATMFILIMFGIVTAWSIVRSPDRAAISSTASGPLTTNPTNPGAAPFQPVPSISESKPGEISHTTQTVTIYPSNCQAAQKNFFPPKRVEKNCQASQ